MYQSEFQGSGYDYCIDSAFFQRSAEESLVVSSTTVSIARDRFRLEPSKETSSPCRRDI